MFVGFRYTGAAALILVLATSGCESEPESARKPSETTDSPMETARANPDSSAEPTEATDSMESAESGSATREPLGDDRPSAVPAADMAPASVAESEADGPSGTSAPALAAADDQDTPAEYDGDSTPVVDPSGKAHLAGLEDTPPAETAISTEARSEQGADEVMEETEQAAYEPEPAPSMENAERERWPELPPMEVRRLRRELALKLERYRRELEQYRRQLEDTRRDIESKRLDQTLDMQEYSRQIARYRNEIRRYHQGIDRYRTEMAAVLSP